MSKELVVIQRRGGGGAFIESSSSSAHTDGTGGPGGEVMYTLGALVEQVRVRYVGMRITLASIYRWQREGFRGVRLETWRVPGGLVSSVQAFDRFVRAINGGERDQGSGIRHQEGGGREQGEAPEAMSAERVADVERARRARLDAELGKRGVGKRQKGSPRRR